jgi:5'-nucleotidase
MEGRFLGLPAIAVSLVGEEFTHFETAAQVVLSLLQRLKNDPLPADTILNVNVPDVPYEALEGFSVTRLGRRHKSEPVVKMQDPRGKDIFWVGPVGAEQDAGEGTDFHAVRQNRVSLTPLHVDLTRYSAMEQISGWVAGL